jgi:shikimate kinase
MSEHGAPFPKVNLYLVGFMGTGKSTVGRVLAQRLGMRLLDSDAEIERRAGVAIAEIFATRGEVAFRDLEREFVEGGHPAEGCIVSCGGGLVLQEGMIERLRRHGVVVCLTARPETILARTQTHKTRPLLNVADPLGRITELLAVREPIYRAAGTQVLTDHRPLGEIVAHVQRIYLREAREFRPSAPA